MKNLILATKVIFVLILFLCQSQGAAEVTQSDKGTQTVGWVERVGIFPGNLKIKAKLDTGAKNSSLNAAHIATFKRNGEKWVRFDMTNWKGRVESIETRVIRTAKIKQHDRKPVMRPVIRLGICLGTVYKEVEVNLEDRSKFNYQMLIGRSYLKDSFLVDASATFTLEPACQKNIDQ